MRRKNAKRFLCRLVFAALLSLTVCGADPLHLAAASSAPARAKSSGSAAGRGEIAGQYKKTEGSKVGTVTVSTLKSDTDTVNIDVVSSGFGANHVADCHFNFDVPLRGNAAEFKNTENQACTIRIKFRKDRLELIAGDGCSNPSAPSGYSGSCEGGASVLNGEYKKVSGKSGP